jgi:hypothetical protein
MHVPHLNIILNVTESIFNDEITQPLADMWHYET